MRGKATPTGKQDIKASMTAFQAKCHAMGMKVTPQRMVIYKFLLETTEHPSAEMVFRRVRRILPSISLDTVNRTLLTLSDMGLAFIVEGSGDAKRFDANLKTHQHFKCIACKRIIDLHHEAFDEIEIPKNLEARFTVLKKTVYLEGLCGRCKTGARPVSQASGKRTR